MSANRIAEQCSRLLGGIGAAEKVLDEIEGEMTSFLQTGSVWNNHTELLARWRAAVDDARCGQAVLSKLNNEIEDIRNAVLHPSPAPATARVGLAYGQQVMLRDAAADADLERAVQHFTMP